MGDKYARGCFVVLGMIAVTLVLILRKLGEITFLLNAARWGQ